MHIRCPHCQNRIEVVDDSQLNDVCCPSCGSAFNLVGSGLTTKPLETRTLGHFELLEQLGFGHFGSVWKARDKELDRIVAVKIPRRDDLTEAEADFFFREARAAAQLRHPNIVSVHEVGREGETIYIVSDYIQGANLRQWLSGQKLTAREAAELCAKIADALHDAHMAGVVHRDLKPENIMMDLTGEPHIMDFGLAKRESGEITMTRDGHVLGTPAYMPPEQARGEGHHADRRSDVYSLGVILYELLTGELPFRGEMRMLIVQILRDEPPSPRKLNSRIPRDLETICLKCLEKDPHRRYQTANELAADLKRYVDGEVILARPTGRIRSGWRWIQRHPARASLIAAAAVVLVTSVAAGVNLANKRELERVNAKLALANSQLEKAHDDLDQVLYLRRVSSALSAWNEGKVATCRKLLAECPPQRRHLEWYYVDRICHSELLTFQHLTPVYKAVVSSDGRRIVGASVDQTVKALDAETGQETLTFKGHKELVTSVASSPDGRRIASGSNDKTVKVWDAMSGEEILTFKGHADVVNGVAFSSDGRRIASGSDDKTVKVWDALSGEQMLTFKGHGDLVTSVAFNSDGRRIVSGSADGTAKLWNAATGQDTLTLKGHTGPVFNAVFSPNGQRILTAGADGTMKIWDATTGAEVLMLERHSTGVTSATFSVDGRRIVSAGMDKTVKVWDAEAGLEILTLKGHSDIVLSAVFSPDGQRIVSASMDGVKVWDAAARPEARTFKGHEEAVNSVAFSPDGRLIASGSDDKTVKTWDAATGQEKLTLKGHSDVVNSVAFSADGPRIASGSDDKTVKVWDAVSGEQLVTFKGHADGVNSVAISPDGRRIASGSDDKTVKVWDTVSGLETLMFKEHTDIVNSVAFSSDARWIVSASDDMTVKVWDVATGQERSTLKHPNFVMSAAFSADGRWIVTSGFGFVTVWDVVTGHENVTLGGDSALVMRAAFSPDGRRIVSANLDGTVQVWDATTGQEALTLKAHTHPVASIAFSADGQRIASASGDNELKVWDAGEGCLRMRESATDRAAVK